MKGLRLGLSLVGGSSAFDPASLSPLVWYDASDLTTMFQDAAASTPVTANNDPVRRINDKSGNANHATCVADTNRPLYKTGGYLEFDGSDDYLDKQFGATQTQPFTRISVVRQITWSAGDRLIGDFAGNHAALMQTDTGASPQLALTSAGSAIATNGNLAVGTTGIVTEIYNGASSSLKINNGTPTTGDTGSNGADGIRLGAGYYLASVNGFANCRIHEVIMVAGAMSAANQTATINYLAAKHGISV